MKNLSQLNRVTKNCKHHRDYPLMSIVRAEKLASGEQTYRLCLMFQTKPKEAKLELFDDGKCFHFIKSNNGNKVVPQHTIFAWRATIRESLLPKGLMRIKFKRSVHFDAEYNGKEFVVDYSDKDKRTVN